MDAMTDPRRPTSDPTHPELHEGDQVLDAPLVADVVAPTSVVGPDGDPQPTPGAEDPEGADD
jgi:hypothetical protein